MRTAHALHHPVSVQTYPWLSSPLLRYYLNISKRIYTIYRSQLGGAVGLKAITVGFSLWKRGCKPYNYGYMEVSNHVGLVLIQSWTTGGPGDWQIDGQRR